MCVREAAGGGGEGARDTESKTRTPHKVVGKNPTASLTARKSHSKEFTQERRLTAKKSHNKEASKKSHCTLLWGFSDFQKSSEDGYV